MFCVKEGRKEGTKGECRRAGAQGGHGRRIWVFPVLYGGRWPVPRILSTDDTFLCISCIPVFFLHFDLCNNFFNLIFNIVLFVQSVNW